MKNGKLLITTALGIAVATLAGIGGFALGKTSEQKQHQIEKEFSMWKEFDKIVHDYFYKKKLSDLL